MIDVSKHGGVELGLARPDDERLEPLLVFEDGTRVEIASANHDEHGWSGMGLLEKAVMKIGEALEIGVIDL